MNSQKPGLTPRVASSINSSSVYAGVTQLVECNLAKVDVEGSNPFARSTPYNQGVMEKKDPEWGKVLPKVLPCFPVLRMYH